MKQIPFCKAYITDQDKSYVNHALSLQSLSGDGPYTKKCHKFLEEMTGSQKSLITQSCTSALEMSALLLDINPGDEVILPSYTFVSTANAFVLRGATPVFVDIRPDTLNINEALIIDAITEKTKAIVPVHYAGVACEMDIILKIAKNHNLTVVEDAAQGVFAFYKGKHLGSIGDMGCYSFHSTKNIISGEGGALLLQNEKYSEHAEIIREKGTDRSRFFKGQVDKYTWQSIGSSYLPSELTAALLLSQLEQAREITKGRLDIWNKYHEGFKYLENQEKVRCPIIPENCIHNAHMYYLLLDKKFDRQGILDKLKNKGIGAVYHYIPLHSSPAGLKYGRVSGEMKYTDDLSERIIRLPLWNGMKDEEINYIVKSVKDVLC